MTISLLNLDTSYPVADSYHATNTAGVIRYVNASDANALSAMQRYMGDSFHRIRLVEDKLNAVITSFNTNPYTSGFDDTTFVKTDGTHPFTSPIPGVTPTLSSHLATKGYTDGSVATVQSSVAALSTQVDHLESILPLVRVSDWVDYTWSAGEKTHLTFTLTPTKADITDVVLMSITERLNLGTEESPQYIYMQYVAGNSANFKIDALWLDDTNTDILHVLIPNDVNYPDGYPAVSGYADLQAFSQRSLKAVVIHATGAC